MKNRFILSFLAFSFLFAFDIPKAEAGRSGKIYVLKKRLPFRLRSRRALNSFISKNRTKHLWPDKKDKKKWKLEFFAYFRRKVNDREVKVRFYDISRGKLNKQFIDGDSIYLDKRGQKELASNFELEKGRFKNNQKILMYILDSHRHVLAEASFYLRGKAEVYSGKVTFSEEEAAGKKK